MSARVTEALKPCPNPWCRKPVEVPQPVCLPGEGWRVYCVYCGVSPPRSATPEEAIAAWNTRHREQATAELVEADAMTSIVAAVLAEVEKATRKFPTWPTRIIDAGNVVTEEAGELAKACLQVTYEKQKETLEGVRMEAIQTAAMCIRFLASMDRYDCSPGPQHKQFGYEPKYCDHCGAIKGEVRTTHCAPPFSRQEHEWTGKHPADARAILSRHEPTDADLLDQVCRGMEEVSKPLPDSDTISTRREPGGDAR